MPDTWGYLAMVGVMAVGVHLMLPILRPRSGLEMTGRALMCAGLFGAGWFLRGWIS